MEEQKDLHTEICLYFKNLKDTLTELQESTYKQFSKFKEIIMQMSESEQKKYKEHLYLIDEIGFNGNGEGEWVQGTELGKDFALHHLKNHKLNENPYCYYCNSPYVDLSQNFKNK